ncbi:prepilin-type N-terminal cleavage/methylation domain-containing protein [Vibrio sp. T187]|uniref:prepilin-type N-terminal cleavage/methylation domain-containing protein n=1 Tax=Vibrio TaxID=662 RepID=UPI0010C9DED3|nr:MULTISPECIES: prepilin-type N-terminal cleavage/methylation domain-containing protein [Vibrio]MBW3697987.1 prepilin-type N-terminal cleavage/methylation domain-containing protein [Vibrio sp. T187]
MICKQKGFSLIEVLISFLLIGVSALGLVKLQVYVEQKADYAIQSIEALHFAERQMEYYRTRAENVSGAVGLIAFSELGLAEHCLNVSHTNSLSGLAGSGYDYSCSVVDVSGVLSGALKSVNVTVTWTDRLNITQSLTLETMLSKYSEFD